MAVSTHVLDTAAGRPAAGVPVHLEIRRGDGWAEVGRGVTDADGRVADLLGGGPLDAAEYRLTFEVDAYHDGRGFYPEAIVTFRATDPDEHYHVPLLLSPFGYATYRGS